MGRKMKARCAKAGCTNKVDRAENGSYCKLHGKKGNVRCRIDGCGNRIERIELCQEHLDKMKRRSRERADHDRHEFYSTDKWERARQRYIRKQPLCEAEGCEAKPTEVDHIEPLRNGGHPTREHNLQALCKSCHSKKTYDEVDPRSDAAEKGMEHW